MRSASPRTRTSTDSSCPQTRSPSSIPSAMQRVAIDGREVRNIRLYDYTASGNCYKVRLLLAQLGRAYERVPVDIFGGDTLTDEYAALNPFRSTPVLELEDGRVLIESNAILWYLASGTPFLPSDPFSQAEVCRWLLYEQTDVMPMF